MFLSFSLFQWMSPWTFEYIFWTQVAAPQNGVCWPLDWAPLSITGCHWHYARWHFQCALLQVGHEHCSCPQPHPHSAVFNYCLSEEWNCILTEFWFSFPSSLVVFFHLLIGYSGFFFCKLPLYSQILMASLSLLSLSLSFLPLPYYLPILSYPCLIYMIFYGIF
jgi:hypothetical protein